MRNIGFIVDVKDGRDEAYIRKWAEFAHQQDIDGLELLFNEPDHPVFDADMIKRAIAGTGVEILACGYWRLNTTDPDPATREVVRARMFSFIDMAAAIGSKIAFFSAGCVEEGNTDKNIEGLREELAMYNAYAAAKNVTIANYMGHGENFIKSYDILKRVCEEVPQFNIKADPVGMIRNLHADPYEVVRDFGDRIVHFHVKDVLHVGDREFETMVGMGDITWSTLFGLLYYHGYNGAVVIEPHGPRYGKEPYRADAILMAKKHIEQFMFR